MKSFSQRRGLKPVSEVVQLDSMSEELRNSLWNALDVTIWSTKGFMFHAHTMGSSLGDIEGFSQDLWFHYFKKPIDSRPGHDSPGRGIPILKEVRNYFFACRWNEVYDFLEFVVQFFSRSKPHLSDALNTILKRELAGYTIIGGIATDITGEQERAMLEEALADTRFAPVTAHLERALQLLADRQNPDYRNSIKESISAVEAMARVVTETPKATLGEALKVLERSKRLHPAL